MALQILKLTLFSGFLAFGLTAEAQQLGTSSQRNICAPAVEMLMSNRRVRPSEAVEMRLFRLCIFRLNNSRANHGGDQLIDEQDLVELLATELEVEI